MQLVSRQRGECISERRKATAWTFSEQGSQTDTAAVSSTTADPNSANNSSTATTSVTEGTITGTGVTLNGNELTPLNAGRPGLGNTKLFAQGFTRDQVAGFILASDEYRNNLIQSYYMRFLDRAADQGGQNAFLNAFKSGATDQEIIAGLIGSPSNEFYNKTAP